MLCSVCSNPIKPIVAVDIDGTLGDYHGHFMRFSEEYMGYAAWERNEFWGPLPYDASQGAYRDYWAEAFSSDVKMYRQVKLAYRQGGMKRSMPMFAAAYSLCETIRDAGAELWVTTTRPYLSLDNIVPDTVAWLERHDIQYDGMLFDDDKYEQLADRVDRERVAAVFDDTPELCEAADKLFPGNRVWMVTGTGNYGFIRDASCDLSHAVDLAHMAVRQWEADHERA